MAMSAAEKLVAAAANPKKFIPFEIHSTSYKIVNEHPIGVDVLVPKELKPKNEKCPLIVRFHGGFLVTGASLMPLFFTNWILELALLKGAIIVSADYRLLPEANGKDILADIADLWRWVHNNLQPFVSQKAPKAPEIDFDHVLVEGDSTGGWLAIQSALTQPAGSIKAVIGLYPQLDMRDAFYNTKFEKPLFGMPMQPSEIVDEHVKAMAPGAVVTSAELPSRLDLTCSMVQNGRVMEFLGEAKELFPLEMVALADSMPAVLILHGSEDSAVPVAGSKRFVEALKERLPESAIRLDVRTGEHAFDGDATMKEEWLKEDVEFITKYWLA